MKRWPVWWCASACRVRVCAGQESMEFDRSVSNCGAWHAANAAKITRGLHKAFVHVPPARFSRHATTLHGEQRVARERRAAPHSALPSSQGCGPSSGASCTACFYTLSTLTQAPGKRALTARCPQQPHNNSVADVRQQQRSRGNSPLASRQPSRSPSYLCFLLGLLAAPTRSTKPTSGMYSNWCDRRRLRKVSRYVAAVWRSPMLCSPSSALHSAT